MPGTHNFPMSFFEAKYVVTVDPYPLSYASDTELGHKLNAKFAELRDGTHTLAATFDMGNGYTFTIWERVAAVPKWRPSSTSSTPKMPNTPKCSRRSPRAGLPPTGYNTAPSHFLNQRSIVRRSIAKWKISRIISPK